MTAWAHWSGQPQRARLDQPGPVGRPPHSLSLARPNPNPLLSGDCESPATSSLDSGERWRAPPSPCGVFAPPRQALPFDHGDSSVLPPFIAIDIASERRLVNLALCGSICFCSILLGLLPPLLGACGGVPAASLVGWRLQPRRLL
jgi:hypothetical protein